MTRVVTVTDAKAHLLALIDEVVEGEEIELIRHGRPVARLVPATGPNAMRGALTGLAVATVEDDELFTTGILWDLP
jgi:prevent-host-death family protein